MKMRHMIRYWISPLCIAVLLVTSVPIATLGEEINISDSKNAIEGESFGVAMEREIPKDCIVISTAEELAAFAENCRLDTWSVGKNVVLANDIDVSGMEFSGIPSFGGIFYGQGYKISGIELNQKGSVIGFFRYVQENAAVYDLNIEGNIEPEGSGCTIGGVAGHNAGTIENCVFSGKLSGVDQIGGIVGINTDTGVIENCKTTGVIFGNHFVGGITGDNQGIIRGCMNEAKINTEAVQNNIAIEDITIDSLINTEYANTITDIGGIAGISAGVIRGCSNYGQIGYMAMGYNVGGIAGTQSGYLVECKNYADVYGRKEVGGIVGQLEPNIALDYSDDGMEGLQASIDGLQLSVTNLKNQLLGDKDEINVYIDAIQENIADCQTALENLESILDTEEQLPDTDAAVAEMKVLSESLIDLLENTQKLINVMDKTMTDVSDGLDDLNYQLEKLEKSIGVVEDSVQITVRDVSDEDTEEDVLGKVSLSENYGTISGDFSVGGIVGVMAEENDLDERTDVEVSGEESLNVSYKIRAVVRDCKNHGTITAKKMAAGGITGLMYLGCVLESVNFGNIDSASADYVGGIVGDSYTIIRDCASKCIISGDTYVGGIAGDGDVVTGCYAFVEIADYTEYCGAIMGCADELPKHAITDNHVQNNFYFTTNPEVGGIDGVSYAVSAQPLSLEEFLAIEGLEEAFKTVTLRFVAEGQEDVIVTLPTGSTLTKELVPTLPAVNGEDGMWEGLEEVLSDAILFDMEFVASYDDYSTVIKSDETGKNGLPVALAEGAFSKDTVLTLTDRLSEESVINGSNAYAHWHIDISNEGDVRLHFLIPEDVDAQKVQLLVCDASGNWVERDAKVDGSYLIFDYADDETAIALVEAEESPVGIVVAGAAIIVLVAVVIVIVVMVRKRKVKTK